MDPFGELGAEPWTENEDPTGEGILAMLNPRSPAGAVFNPPSLELRDVSITSDLPLGAGTSGTLSFSFSFFPRPIALAIVAPNDRDLTFRG